MNSDKQNKFLPLGKSTVAMHDSPAVHMQRQRGQRRPHLSMTTQQAR